MKSRAGDQQKEDHHYSDGFDEDYFGDEEDRKRLMSMTEMEREAIIYERSRERAKRREIKALKARVHALENHEHPRERPKEEAISKTHTPAPKKHQDVQESLTLEEAQSIFLSRDFFEKYHLYPDLID